MFVQVLNSSQFYVVVFNKLGNGNSSSIEMQLTKDDYEHRISKIRFIASQNNLGGFEAIKMMRRAASLGNERANEYLADRGLLA